MTLPGRFMVEMNVFETTRPRLTADKSNAREKCATNFPDQQDAQKSGPRYVRGVGLNRRLTKLGTPVRFTKTTERAEWLAWSG
jgi:hypothetical protein